LALQPENPMASKTRILFVDDDPDILDGLQGLMSDMADKWDMTFLGGGREGLAAFAEAPFDVVVSDLWMPGMDGAEFLREIHSLYPGCIRFIHSSSTDRDLAIRLVERAHQFIEKPCQPAFLKTVITRVLYLRNSVQNEPVLELVTRLGQLPTVPSLYREISDLLASDRATADNLNQFICKDAAMTAMVLKLVNSAFFNLRRTVSMPAEALHYLGVDLLKSLVLAHGLFNQMAAFGIPSFTIDHLWRHSLSVASAAKRIAEAEAMGNRCAAECFTAGILHDVGILILASRLPEDYQRVLHMNLQEGCDLAFAEHHVFGASHAEVGGYLLGLWGLPAPIVQATLWHDDPRKQEIHGFSPTIAVHVANAVCAADQIHEVFSRATLDEGYLAAIGLKHTLEQWQERSRGGPASSCTKAT
jgi:HD-like signal output (HDOD) protein